jgi:hypothetical protein
MKMAIGKIIKLSTRVKIKPGLFRGLKSLKKIVNSRLTRQQALHKNCKSS